MQFINYFFASITSFLGLLIGVMLVKIAPEEQKPLKRYFILARRVLLLMIFIFAMFYYFNNNFYILTLIAYFVFLLFIDYKIKDLLKNSIVVYTFLGILFFLSSKNANLFAIESSLILLYGKPAAFLIYNRQEKVTRLIFYNIGFIIIANLLFFV